MRAVRFSAELGFTIEKETMDAVVKFAHRLEKIAAERLRDEFPKIILRDRPMGGIVLLQKTEVLKHVLPELEEGLGCEQNGDHIYHVWEHNLRALQHSADRRWPLHVRVAALLHDVAKPATRKWSDEKKDWTFYGHDVVGGRMSAKMLERLKFPRKFIDDVSLLVRYHLFFSDKKKDWTFYGHDVVGGRMSAKMLERLKFPRKFIDDVSLLVRYHLFFSD